MTGIELRADAAQSWVARHATLVFALTALLTSYAALGLMILVDRGPSARWVDPLTDPPPRAGTSRPGPIRGAGCLTARGPRLR